MSVIVDTVTGTGAAGCSDTEINNPYGLAIGPDDALYFCDLGNQLIRRLDVASRELTTIAGNGERGYAGDGGPAADAALDMPHELCFNAAGDLLFVERDNHAVRKVTMATGVISTVAGVGEPGFGGDGGPAVAAHLRQPHSIAFDPRGDLLICDIGNHRIRRLDRRTGVIDTFAGTGEQAPTSDGAPLVGTALNGPRTIVVGPQGTLYIALREGNAVYCVDPTRRSFEHLAGTGARGFSGDGDAAQEAMLAGPKGLAHSGATLYVADTENHAIRAIDLETGGIVTVLGTGERLARPHGLCVGRRGEIYVADSEAHRILRVSGADSGPRGPA